MNENKYDVQKAEEDFTVTATIMENKISALKTSRDALGTSLHGLKQELGNVKGEHARATLEKIISDRSNEMKEIETSIELRHTERQHLNLSDFMGEGKRVIKMDASTKRSQMDGKAKVSYITAHGMHAYSKLPY